MISPKIYMIVSSFVNIEIKPSFTKVLDAIDEPHRFTSAKQVLKMTSLDIVRTGAEKSRTQRS